MIKCRCSKCSCLNDIKEFGHGYEEENALVAAKHEKDVGKVESIISEICQDCIRGQHQGEPKNQ
ncbi:MAG: hypothetical protein ACE5RJ_02735 [Nitrosopumilaceae archaeon]